MPRLPLAGVALAAVAGILAGEHAAIPATVLLAVAAAGLVLAPRRAGLLPLLAAVAAVFALVHTWQWREDPWRAWARAVAPGPRTATVTGVVSDEPQKVAAGRDGTGVWRAAFTVEQWDAGTETVRVTSGIVLRWSAAEPPRYGDRWRVEGVLDAIAPPRNPGEFDAAAWWGRQGVFLELRNRDASRAALLARGCGWAVKAAALEARAWMIRTLGLGLGDAPAIAALVAGITLGARDPASDEFAAAFRQTGTFHLFSVSGLHVGMFALLVWIVLRPLGVPRRAAVLVIIPLLFFYALVTGASPPSVRAAVMLAVAFGGFLLDRDGAPANSLAAAALVLLGWDTNQLFSTGFQMSFSIVAAIFVLAPPLRGFLAAHLRPDPFLPRRLYNRRQRVAAAAGRDASAALSVSMAAWLGSLPLTVLVFHLVPLLAVPANVLAVPLAFAVLAVAMLSLLAAPFSLWLAAVFNNTNWGLATLLAAGVQSTASLPGAYAYLPPAWMQPPATLTVFDLSDGGAQLLRTRHAAWLIDAGSASDFTRIIEPALRAAGVGRLDGLVLTHGDAAHAGGARHALDLAPPARILVSAWEDRSRVRRDFLALLHERRTPKAIALPGDRFPAGRDVSITVLAPLETGRTADDQSIAALADILGFRVLLMADSGAGTEQTLVARHGDGLRSDVLVLGRHVSDITATQEFLAAVRPRVVVLGAADPFREGSGEPALRERLAATGAEVFDQAACGAVIMVVSDESAVVQGFIDGRSFTMKRP